MTNWNELSVLRHKWMALEGTDAVEIHGWLLGVAVAIERQHSVNPATVDALIAELRASEPPRVDNREMSS